MYAIAAKGSETQHNSATTRRSCRSGTPEIHKRINRALDGTRGRMPSLFVVRKIRCACYPCSAHLSDEYKNTDEDTRPDLHTTVPLVSLAVFEKCRKLSQSSLSMQKDTHPFSRTILLKEAFR